MRTYLRMTKLRTLSPLVRTLDTRTTRPPPKQKDLVYTTPEFLLWRKQVMARAGGRCEAVDNGHRCSNTRPDHRLYADHIVELRDGGSVLDLNNGQCLCHIHHQRKTIAARIERLKR
jgi:5-methylcytosine-specific restriction enzyme A